jgi:GT2 family glycosyltransferase
LDMDLGIVVVDNASGDGSPEKITETLAGSCRRRGYELCTALPADTAGSNVARRLHVMDAGRNGGYAFGNNVGARIALADPACEFVWILNSDTTVPGPSALHALLQKMDSQSDIGICGSTVVYMENPDTVQTFGGGCFDARWGRCTQYGQGMALPARIDEPAIEAKLSYINGACSLIRRSYFEQIGFMDEGYFLYYEEIDWAFAGKLQFRLGYCADSIVHHSVGATIGTRDTGERSQLSTFYLTKSRIRFLRRFSPRSLPLALLDLIREVAQNVKKRRWRTVKTILQAMSVKAN